jgi:hypothetical protein
VKNSFATKRKSKEMASTDRIFLSKLFSYEKNNSILLLKNNKLPSWKETSGSIDDPKSDRPYAYIIKENYWCKKSYRELCENDAKILWLHWGTIQKPIKKKNFIFIGGVRFSTAWTVFTFNDEGRNNMINLVSSVLDKLVIVIWSW